MTNFLLISGRSMKTAYLKSAPNPTARSKCQYLSPVTQKTIDLPRLVIKAFIPKSLSQAATRAEIRVPKCTRPTDKQLVFRCIFSPLPLSLQCGSSGLSRTLIRGKSYHRPSILFLPCVRRAKKYVERARSLFVLCNKVRISWSPPRKVGPAIESRLIFLLWGSTKQHMTK